MWRNIQNIMWSEKRNSHKGLHTVWFHLTEISRIGQSTETQILVAQGWKINKQGDNIQPWRTPFPIWNQSVGPRLVLTVASWPAYRFLRRQVRWSGISISFENFPQFVVIHTVKSFGVANKAEIDVFWNSLAFFMIQQMLAIWSLVPLPFLSPAWTSGSPWFTYCWSLTWRILSITLLKYEMSAIVW